MGETNFSQSLFLSPEAKQILGQELQLFGQQFIPEQEMAFSEILRRLGSPTASVPSAQGLRQASGTARQATRQAGATYGLPAAATGPVQEDLLANEDDLLKALQAFFEQVGTRQRSLVDPRFAQFLSPQLQRQPTSPSTADSVIPAVVQGAEIASRFV